MIAEATYRLLLLVVTYLFVFVASKAQAINLENFDFSPYEIKTTSKDLQNVITFYQNIIKSRVVQNDSQNFSQWPTFTIVNFKLMAERAAGRSDYFDLNQFDGLGAASKDNHIVMNTNFIKDIVSYVGGESAATPLVNFILGHEMGHDIYEVGIEELRKVVSSPTGLKLPVDGSNWFYDPRYSDNFNSLEEDKKDILITDSVIKNSQPHALVDIIGIEVLKRSGLSIEGVRLALNHFLKFMQSPDMNIPSDLRQRIILETQYRIWNLKDYLSRKP